MAQMKLRTKIVSGFVAVVALLVVVSAVAIFFLAEARTGFVTYRGWARDSNLMSNVQGNMLMVRMNVKDFLIRGTQQEVDEYRGYYDTVAELIETATAEIQNPERAAMVEEIKTEVERYDRYFTEVIAFQGDRDIHYQTLVDVGPRIERNLTLILTSAREDGDMVAAYNASLATRSLLLARLYAMKFLDTNARADADRVEAETNTMEEYLSILDAELQNPTRRALLEQVRTFSGEYFKGFEKMVEAIYARNGRTENGLDKIGPNVADLANQVKLSVQADQDALGPKLQRQMYLAGTVVVIVSIVAIVAAVLTALLIVRSVMKQLGADPAAIEAIMKRLVIGDTDVEFTGTGHKGVYRSVREMVEAIRAKAKSLSRIADNDFTEEIVPASDVDALGIALKTMQESVADVLTQAIQASQQVQAGAGQVSQASQDLSQGATEQASSLEEISSSVNEINGQSRRNADNSVEANNLARQAAADAEQGNEQMTQLREAMTNISYSSEEITKVVKVIDDIAFQINLLALNANVEAARAGKYGKGFAVVADEVRNLAVRSAEAVKETTAMVEESVKNIERGNKMTETTADKLSGIVDGSTKVAQFLEEIAAASREQAQAIDQITEGLSQVDRVTQSNTASAEESASASEELASQAQQLFSVVAQFKLRDTQWSNRPNALEYAPAEVASGGGVGSRPVREAVVAGADPHEVIALDDDDFDRF